MQTVPGDSTLQYTLSRSLYSKRMTLTIGADNQLIVRAPWYIKRAQIEDWLYSKRSQIHAQRAQYLVQQQGIAMPDRICLPSLDQTYFLVHNVHERYALTSLPKVKRDGDDGLLIQRHPQHEVLSVYRALRPWLKSLGRKYLPVWLDQVSQEIGMEYGKVSIRYQKTRWGSCSSKKNISLNARLLLLPAACVRSVMIHELCHTQEMNHSKQFWQKVRYFDPQEVATRKMLKTFCKQHWYWVV